MTHKNKDEIHLILKDYKESGLSLSSFCLERNIARSTLSTWIKKYDTDLNNESKFYKVTDIVKDTTIQTNNISRVINLSYKDLDLKFDLGILKDVLEVLND